MPIVPSQYPPQGQPPRRRFPIKIVIALLIAGFVLVKYWSSYQSNPVTGHSQPIPWTVEQEIALGLQSAPRMAAEFGGESADKHYRDLVESVGARIIASLPKEARKADGSPAYPFKYHVLADQKTVNAFALPGGQVFITEALLKRLESEGQLAGVLGHESGHVLARHSAQQLAKSELLQGLVGAATVAGSNSQSGAQTAQAVSSMVANMMSLKYSRNDELEADQLGLRFMYLAGYDPKSMIRVMEILEQASGGAAGQHPEYSSTHPNPEHRVERIQAWLKENFPNGEPAGLRP